MTSIESDLIVRLYDRVTNGGISGGQEDPSKFRCVQANLNGMAVIFDLEKHSHSVETEPDNSMSMHSVKAKDGREAYFEVDKDGRLYAFLSFGLNVEIWKGLLVIGASSDKDEKRKGRVSQGR